MSLIYNEFEGENKNGSDEEIKMEKMDVQSKKSKKKKTRKKTAEKKDEEKKDITPIKEKEQNDKYDTSMEGLEIPLLNNNINTGSLMLTELLDIDNNNKEDFINSNNNTNINNRTLNAIENNNNNNNNSSFLKNKLDKVNIPKSLKSNITSRIEKSHDELHDDFKNDLLNISNKRTTINELIAFKQ